MARSSNYDKFPFVAAGPRDLCAVGWPEIEDHLKVICAEAQLVCVECYPGVFVPDVERAMVAALKPARVVRSTETLKDESAVRAMLDPVLGEDRVFGRMNGITLADYFDENLLANMRYQLRCANEGLTLVLGTGAAMIAPEYDVLIYADLARWEIQQRWRNKLIGNFGLSNAEDDIGPKYKCGYFVEWRVADREKKGLLAKVDCFLDTKSRDEPKMISGDALRAGMKRAVHQPFRVVPYFDPGPWGGHWMEEVCDLPRDQPNYAWCFDCVPEENSLLLGFGDVRVEMPSINLVFEHPRELLGNAVHARFGTEFPIRFDFLDTMGGGNLSLQVHPLTEYIQDQFGMHYTQDESYYLLDAGQDASVYLGLKNEVSAAAFQADLEIAQAGGPPFPATQYINEWPAKKHDHFLIPAGTVHCSGADSMVLEISATPYIFTFKLWDWGRLGLDGVPRPIHIEHGIRNIQWNRTTKWVKQNLVNQFETITSGPGWREERTGLHEREFIETRRHWFTGPVPHDTDGGVNVLNLVEGAEAVIESPTQSFHPFVVHYAETFIIPAVIGAYTIRPHGLSEGKECATIKAFVRTHA